MSDWWNQPGGETPSGPRCPWCGASATPEATVCPNCGDSLAQREDLGGLAIPGVTTVDPALLHEGGISPAAGLRTRTSAISMAANMGGLAGAVGAGAVFLAADALSGLRGGKPGTENLGKPSEAAATFAARLAEADRRFAVPPEASPASEAPPTDGASVDMALATAPDTAPTAVPDTAPENPTAADSSAWWNQPGGGAAGGGEKVACPWCGARCAPDATICEGCGAGLVVESALDTLQIPGVTTVDPALAEVAGRKTPAPSVLGVVGRMGTAGMIMGAVSSMTTARSHRAEPQPVNLDGPNPAIAALAEQMRAQSAQGGSGAEAPVGTGAGDIVEAGVGDRATPENDPWRDLPRPDDREEGQ